MDCLASIEEGRFLWAGSIIHSVHSCPPGKRRGEWHTLAWHKRDRLFSSSSLRLSSPSLLTFPPCWLDQSSDQAWLRSWASAGFHVGLLHVPIQTVHLIDRRPSFRTLRTAGINAETKTPGTFFQPSADGWSFNTVDSTVRHTGETKKK